MKNRYLIASPSCGRDKDGTFICVCGKCKRVELLQARRKGRSNVKSPIETMVQAFRQDVDAIASRMNHGDSIEQKGKQMYRIVGSPYYMGGHPVKVTISFSMYFDDWLKLKESKEWKKVEAILAVRRTELTYKSWQEDKKNTEFAEELQKGPTTEGSVF